MDSAPLEMGVDEVWVMLISLAVGGIGWLVWLTRPSALARIGRRPNAALAFYLSPLVALALLLVVLRTLAAHDVRDDVRYIFMYAALGMAWTLAAARATPLVGVSAALDVYERGNRAAAWTIAGAVVGSMLCYAGGNIGDGPGWWVVVFAAALANAALFVLWEIFAAMTASTDSVTIDRDEAAGLRAGGLLVGLGLILGRAVAGDWVSAGATVADFARQGWPALAVLAAAVFIERRSTPTPARPVAPRVAFGVVPAVFYVGVAALLVALDGIPQ